MMALRRKLRRFFAAIRNQRAPHSHLKLPAKSVPYISNKVPVAPGWHFGEAQPENLKNIRLGWSDTVLAGGDRPAGVKPGDRIIFLFEASLEEERDVVDSGIGPCSYVLGNAQNLAAVEKGIEIDGLSTHP